MKHFKFPEIEQYRHVVKSVRDRATYHGIPLPKIDFIGTVKLHGTNAGIVLDVKTGDLQVQSREQVITPEKDNAGFARFVTEHEAVIRELFSAFYETTSPYLAIYGEWCGQGIMKGVAITQLPKMFVIFGVREIGDHVTPEAEWTDEQMSWVSVEGVTEAFHLWQSRGERPTSIKSIFDFPVFYQTVDFARPEEAQAAFVKITQAVEAECPVGAALGVSGIGEGVVWKPVSTNAPIKVSDLIFKVKGEKHSESKVTKLAAVDVEKVASIRAFAEGVATPHRLEKMVAKLEELGKPIEVKSTGEFIKLVCSDIYKEEADTLQASGFDWKEVSPVVSSVARQWWMTELNNRIMNV